MEELAFTYWLADIRTLAPLPPDAQRDLAVKAQGGDLAARDTLITTNWRLVQAIAKRYACVSELPLMDFIQEGMLGILHALDKYQPDKGIHFTTYATYWIRQACLRLALDRRLIRVPEQVERAYQRVRHARERLLAAGVASTDAALIASGCGAADLAMARRVRSVESLDAVQASDGADDPLTLADHLGDDMAVDPAGQWDHELSEVLDTAFAALTPRARFVVVRRLGLDGPPQTLNQLAQALQMSRENVRIIERRALGTLRQVLLMGEKHDHTRQSDRTRPRPRPGHPVGARSPGASRRLGDPR
jgi:RNA polymerase sigma factor (sigma-70 family)